MITQEKRKWIYQQLIPFVLVYGGIIAVVIYTEIKQHQLRTYPRYTIGTTTGAYWTLGSGKQVEYIYVTNNQIHKLSNEHEYDSKVIGGRYFVKYDTEDPSISKLLQDKPVPDSIKTAPPDGWKEIPVKYDSQ